MRVSCACPVELATSTLVDNLRGMGLHPIITTKVVRVVYEGPNRSLGEAIVELYAHEADHEITVSYNDDEVKRDLRKQARKAERAARNARLHGH